MGTWLGPGLLVGRGMGRVRYPAPQAGTQPLDLLWGCPGPNRAHPPAAAPKQGSAACAAVLGGCSRGTATLRVAEGKPAEKEIKQVKMIRDVPDLLYLCSHGTVQRAAQACPVPPPTPRALQHGARTPTLQEPQHPRVPLGPQFC